MSSDSRYSYDGDSTMWPFFVGTLVGAIVVPITVTRVVSSMRKSSAAKEHSRLNAKSAKPYNSLAIKQYRDKHAFKSLFGTSTLLLAGGWLVMFGCLYVAMTTQPKENADAPYDPWEILGLAMGAAQKEVKSAYRKLSLKYHPDKAHSLKEDLTPEEIESRFIEINKAHQALTDEQTMENFRVYGHPDGPQTTRMGIALPLFLVEGATPFVVLLYLWLGIYGSLRLGRWWASQKLKTRGGIQSKTAAAFFDFCVKKQPVFADAHRVLEAVLERGEADYAEVLPGSTVEQRREALDAYLNRQSTSDEQFKLQVAETTLCLLRQFKIIAFELKYFSLAEAITECERCIVQAVPLELRFAGPYLELPGSEIEQAREAKSKSELNKLVTASLTKDESNCVPKLKLIEAKAFVPGMTTVPPGSKPFFRVRFVVYPNGSKPSEVTSEDLEAIEALERDQLVRDPRLASNPLLANKKDDPVPRANAPFLPFDWQPSWSVFINNERDPRFVNSPALLQNANLSNMKLSDAELASGEKVVIGTWVTQFHSNLPNQEGIAYFRLNVLCDSYFGSDMISRVSVHMKPSIPEAEPEDEDLSEPEDAADEEEPEGLSDLDTDTEDEQEDSK